MADDSSDDNEFSYFRLNRPDQDTVPDLSGDGMKQALGAAAAREEGSTMKARLGAAKQVLRAHEGAMEAIEPHLDQLDDEMKQLTALLQDRFTTVRNVTREQLAEFQDEADFKFATRAAECKKWQSHIAATDTVLEQQSKALTELEEKRVPALEEELEIPDKGTDVRG